MNISKFKKSTLSLIIGTVLTLTLACSGQPVAKYENVNFKELSLKENTIIVDVRTPEEFNTGHIENSINIPLSVLPDSVESLKKFDAIILVCRSGNRSGKAKVLLDEKGFKNVYNGGGWDRLNEKLKNEN